MVILISLYGVQVRHAIKLSIEKNIGPEPINIGTGKEIKICELIETIADIMGFDGKIIYDDNYPDGQPRRCLDITKAKEKLGFEAETNLYEGLNKTIQYFWNHHVNGVY